MGVRSKIEWTSVTWNPFTGCTKVSMGCANCYAERFAIRLMKAGHPKYRNGFKFTVHRDIFDFPLKLKKPRLIFVNSMSDLFHEEADFETIAELFEVMNRADWHIYQVLTKRANRLLEFSKQYSNLFKPHIWIGVTVEHFKYKYRIDMLRQVPAKIRFISAEPLLSSLLYPDGKLDLSGISWIIVGAESGPRARPMDEAWVREIRDEAMRQGVAFFYKQNVVNGRKVSLPELDGRRWNEFPMEIGIKNFL